MVDRDILFSVFTQKKGPIPVFHTLSSQDATRVAFKSQTTLSMMDRSELESAEAILPFTNLDGGKLGFIYLFQMKQQDVTEPDCVASLTYLVPKEQQAFLYSKVPYIKYKAEEIASQIKQYIFEENTPLPKDLQNALKNWYVTEKDTTTEVQIIERRVTLSEKKDVGSIDFLFTQVKKHEDRFLGAIYRGNPVFITGESSILIDMVVHSLDMCIPQAQLRKVSYTERIIDPQQADLIGIKKDLTKHYPQATLVDIDKKQVRQGKSCDYSKGIIKHLKKEPNNAELILTESHTQILDVSNLLIDAFSHPDVVRDQMIKDVQKNYDEYLIEVAVDLAAKNNPLIKELLYEKVVTRFVDWMDGF